ncbi:MAG TPA: molybdopterin-guanine dinucleotide biosynthesis protein B [Burkholderiales bacterium]
MQRHIFGFAGYSGSGKTTLIEQLIPRFVEAGLKVSLIKHAHHDFDIDKPGKDSHRHRQAGALEVLITSNTRWALMHELRGAPEPTLEEQLRHLAPCDLALVEGYKREAIPKLEIHRPSLGHALLQPDDSNIVAVAADGPVKTLLPVLDLNQPAQVAEFIMRHLNLVPR